MNSRNIHFICLFHTLKEIYTFIYQFLQFLNRSCEYPWIDSKCSSRIQGQKSQVCTLQSLYRSLVTNWISGVHTHCYLSSPTNLVYLLFTHGRIQFLIYPFSKYSWLFLSAISLCSSRASLSTLQNSDNFTFFLYWVSKTEE